MRHGVATLRGQNVVFLDGIIKIALAEAEAQLGDAERAIAVLDEGLATADRLGNRTFEAELHRVRGQVLLNRDPANPAPSEEAFLTAIAVAKQQGTRSFELRAALALAKLYRATGRSAPKRWRPHSAIGCSGVFCNNCDDDHSTQVCGVSPRRP